VGTPCHRIRHYGLFAQDGRAENLFKVRALLNVQMKAQPDNAVAATGVLTDN
jgi:hypothetical protein